MALNVTSQNPLKDSVRDIHAAELIPGSYSSKSTFADHESLSWKVIKHAKRCPPF